MSTPRDYKLPERTPLTIYRSHTLRPPLQHPGFDLPIRCAVIKGESTGDGRFFHFKISFVGADGSAIRIDPSPSYTDPACWTRALLNVEYIRNVDAPSQELEPGPMFRTEVKDGTTAASICHYLLDQVKLDQYMFNSEGQGCRHWCATALERLAQVGIVVDHAPVDFARHEQEQVLIYGDKFLMPRVMGTFY